jgi:hypothetical protein
VNDQDRAIQEGMGPVVDRSMERLGTSDVAIIAMRQRLLKAVRELERGIDPYPAAHGDAYHVRALDAISPHIDLDALLADCASRLTAVA